MSGTKEVKSPTSVAAHLAEDDDHHVSAGQALTQFNEEEAAFKETVQRMAREKIEPLVKKMDVTSHMEQSVIDALFENGVSFLRVSIVCLL